MCAYISLFGISFSFLRAWNEIFMQCLLYTDVWRQQSEIFNEVFSLRTSEQQKKIQRKLLWLSQVWQIFSRMHTFFTYIVGLLSCRCRWMCLRRDEIYFYISLRARSFVHSTHILNIFNEPTWLSARSFCLIAHSSD